VAGKKGGDGLVDLRQLAAVEAGRIVQHLAHQAGEAGR
jgi:hypothetical protein